MAIAKNPSTSSGLDCLFLLKLSTMDPPVVPVGPIAAAPVDTAFDRSPFDTVLLDMASFDTVPLGMASFDTVPLGMASFDMDPFDTVPLDTASFDTVPFNMASANWAVLGVSGDWRTGVRVGLWADRAAKGNAFAWLRKSVRNCAACFTC